MNHQSDKNPLTFKHINILKIFLWTVGGWPVELFNGKKTIYDKFLRTYIPVQTITVFIGQLNYIFHRTAGTSFLILGHVFLTTILCGLTVVRIFLPKFKKYGILIKDFIATFHLAHFKHTNDYAHQMFLKVDKISHNFTLVILTLVVPGIILFNLAPMYNNYKVGVYTNKNMDNTLEFSVYYVYPGFDPTNSYEEFLIGAVWNFYLSYCCAIVVTAEDLLLCLMIFQVIGHIKVLKNNLKSLPLPKRNLALEECSNNDWKATMYNNEENMIIRTKLTECVNHHRLIVNFTDNISEFFGPILGINYLFQLVSGCLLLLECSQINPTTIARYGPLTLTSFWQLIQISVVFEMLGTESETLKDVIYDVPWEYMDYKNRRSVCFMLSKMQVPLRVTAMGLTDVGVQTMAQILKTTFSYFMLLRSMNE